MKKLLIFIISCFFFSTIAKADDVTARQFTFTGFAQFGAAYAAYSFCSFSAVVLVLDDALTELIEIATERDITVEFQEKTYSYGVFYYTIFDMFKDSSYSILLQIPSLEKEKVCSNIGSAVAEDLQRLENVYLMMREYVEASKPIERLETA